MWVNCRKYIARCGYSAAIMMLTIAVFTVFPKVLYAASDTTVPGLDRPLHRAILVNKFQGNPKAQWLTYQTARMVKKGVDPNEILRIRKEVSAAYDEMERLVASGRLPDDDNVRGYLYKAINSVVTGALSGGVTSGLSGVLVEVLSDYTEKSVASDRVDFAGEFLTQQAEDSTVRTGTHVQYVSEVYKTASPEYKQILEQALVQDIGVDINASEDDLLVQNPGVAALLRTQMNGESLMDIYSQMKNAPSRADLDRLKASLMENLKIRLDSLNQGISDEIKGVGDAVRELDAKISRTGNTLGSQIGKNSRLLTLLVKTQAEKERDRLDQERKARERAENQAYFEMGYLLLGQVDPKLAKDVRVVANATIKIQKSISTMTATGFSLGDLGTATSMLNIMTGGLAIANLFSATQPSADQLILQQIAMLQQQIEDLRVEINQRFDVVDRKLDEILAAVQSGFEMVQGRLDKNFDAVAMSTTIGLNTQSLIVGESQRVADLISDFFITPCVKRGNVKIALPDDQFANCAIRLNDYARNKIKDNSESYQSSWSGTELAGFLGLNERGRADNILYDLFSIFSGIPKSTKKIAPQSEWALTSSWYSDFLLKDQDQTRRVLSDFDIKPLVAMGKEIKTFRGNILDSFDGAVNNGYTPVGQLVESGRVISSYIRQIIDAEISAYSKEKGINLLTLQKEFDALEAMDSHSGATSTNATDPGQGLTIVDSSGILTGSTLSGLKSVLGAKLNQDIITAVRHGFGRFVIYNTTGSNKTDTKCLTWFLGACVDRLTYVIYTNIITHIRYEDATGVGVSFEVATISAPWDHADWQLLNGFYDRTIANRHAQTGFRAAWNSQVSNAASLMNVVNPGANITKIRDGWAYHRREVSVRIIDKIIGGPEYLSIDDDTVGKNAYFSSLVRFAFADVIDQSDALHGIGVGNAGLPLIGDLIQSVQSQRPELIFEVPSYIDSEMDVLNNYFQSEELNNLVQAARTQISVDETINRLLATESVLKGVDLQVTDDQVFSGPENTNSNASVNTTDSSGGGGGSLTYEVLLIVILYMYMRATACARRRTFESAK